MADMAVKLLQIRGILNDLFPFNIMLYPIYRPTFLDQLKIFNTLRVNILILKLNLVIKLMSSRYAKMKDYFSKYKIKTKEHRLSLMNFLKTQRQIIIARERVKLRKRLLFWSIFLGGTYVIYNEIYRKNVETRKMGNKLQNFYSGIMTSQTLKEDVFCVTLTPTTIDQLTNLVSLAYRYHYKLIVRMDQVTKRQKIIINQKFGNKCLFINLSNLSKVRIDTINNTLYVESGAKCSQVNSKLQLNGYSPIFPSEFINQTVYDVVVSNLPLNDGQLTKYLVNLELVSASGQNFRSGSETNRYGQIPSLNPLFLGTGGIFALPTAISIKINKLQPQKPRQQILKFNIRNTSERVDALRKFNEVNRQFIDLAISTTLNGPSQQEEVFITCKERYSYHHTQPLQVCKEVADRANVAVIPLTLSPAQGHYSLFFSINERIFESFLLKYDKQLNYEFKNGLLKVQLHDQTHEKYINIINEVTNNNGVLVWCDIPQILLRIKPSIDSEEVGAGLMRKIVEVRQGMDRRSVLYSHSRYQDYFAKGLFRRMTEYFW